MTKVLTKKPIRFSASTRLRLALGTPTRMSCWRSNRRLFRAAERRRHILLNNPAPLALACMLGTAVASCHPRMRCSYAAAAAPRRSPTTGLSSSLLRLLLMGCLLGAGAHGVLAHDHGMAVLPGIVYTSWTPAIAAHAVLMSLLCFIVFPAGVILALRGSHWHKWVQSGGLVVLLIAASIALGDVASEGHGHGASLHGRLGIATLVLLLLLGVAGWITKAVKTYRAQHMSAEDAATAQPHVHANDKGILTADEHAIASASNADDRALLRLATVAYRVSSLFHRRLAGLLLSVLLPFTYVMGLLTATGLLAPNGDSVDNLAAHVGFGAALVLGGLTLIMIAAQHQPRGKATVPLPSTGHHATDTALALTATRASTWTPPVGLLPLPAAFSPLLLEYAIWLFFSVIIIVSQHDWGKPLDPFSGDAQHVAMGAMGTVSCLCGIPAVLLTRHRIRRELVEHLADPQAAAQLRHDLHFDTLQTGPLLLARLPLLLLYSSLGFAMLNHSGAGVFGDTLHYAFGIYCFLLGLAKITGIGVRVYLRPDENAAEIEPTGSRRHSGSRSTRDKLVNTMERIKRAGIAATGRHPSYERLQSAAAQGAQQPYPLRGVEQPASAMPFSSSDDDKDSSALRGGPRLPRTPSPVQQEQAAPVPLRVDWSVESGVEGGGRTRLLSCFLLVLSGVTFSGSCKFALIAASQVFSPALYLLVLAAVTLALITWWTLLCEFAMDAKLKRTAAVADAAHKGHLQISPRSQRILAKLGNRSLFTSTVHSPKRLPRLEEDKALFGVPVAAAGSSPSATAAAAVTAARRSSSPSAMDLVELELSQVLRDEGPGFETPQDAMLRM